MKIRTVDEIYERMSKQSKILHPENTRKGNVWMMDTSKAGLQNLLAERNGEEGFLYWARKEVAIKLGEWQWFKNSSIKKPKEPIGAFAEAINRSRARVKLLESECRWLNNKIREIEKEEQQESAKAVVKSKMRGGIKNRDGAPYSCDGRLLVLNEDEEIVFQDDPKLTLESYLDQVRQERIAKSKIKRANLKSTLLAQAQEKFGEQAVVEKRARRKI